MTILTFILAISYFRIRFHISEISFVVNSSTLHFYGSASDKQAESDADDDDDDDGNDDEHDDGDDGDNGNDYDDDEAALSIILYCIT